MPHDAEICQECGYPFANTQTAKCSACNSIITADVEICPVCSQQREALSHGGGDTVPDDAMAADRRPPVVTAAAGRETTAGVSSVPGVEAGRDVQARTLGEIAAMLQALISAVEKRNNGGALQDERLLAGAVSAMNAASETMASEGRGNAEILQELGEIKAAIADISTRQAAGTEMIVGALKTQSTARETAGTPEMPASLKWLDYIFAAIIVALVFSVLSLLVMAYVARLVLSMT